MKNTMNITYCVLLLSLICCVYLSQTKTTEAKGSGNCFGFPTLDSSLNVSVQENDNLTIPFNVKSNCSNCSKRGCKIYVKHPAESTFGAFCIFVLNGSNCKSVANFNNCRCNKTSGLKMIFTKTVARDDIGDWVWNAQGDTTDQTQINVLYAPEVTEQYPESSDMNGVESGKLSTTRERPTHTRDSPGSITTANDGTRVTGIVTDNSITSWGTPNYTGIKDSRPEDEHSMSMAVTATAANSFAVVAIACTIFVCWRSRTKKRREASGFATTVGRDEASDTIELHRRHEGNVTHDARSTSWDFEKMTFNSQHV